MSTRPGPGRVERLFDVRKMVREYEELYVDVAGGVGSGNPWRKGFVGAD